jgi:hypothetical protein
MAAGSAARGRAPGSALLPEIDGVLDCRTPKEDADLRELTTIREITRYSFFE